MARDLVQGLSTGTRDRAATPLATPRPVHWALRLQSAVGNRATARVVGRRALARAYKQAVNGFQIMDFDDDKAAFAHYSFDAVLPPAEKPKGGAAKGKKGKAPDKPAEPQRDNDHLTIENSTATLLAILGKDRKGAGAYLNQRQTMMKPQHNEYLNAHGFAAVDNFNFRPANQVARPLPGWAPKDRVAPKSKYSEVVEVDRDISLARFLTFLDSVAQHVGLPGAQSGRIINSIRTVATDRMGYQPDQLFLNARQKGEFTTFMLIASQLTGAAVPPELTGLGQAKPTVSVSTGFDEAHYKGSLPDKIFTDIQQSVRKDGTWTRTEGQADFNEVRSYLVNKHWATIKAGV